MVELPAFDLASSPRHSAGTRAQTDMARTNLDVVPQRTEAQLTAGHTPSPNRYEFAVNGLLALSGTEPMFASPNHCLELAQNAPGQGSSMSPRDALLIDNSLSSSEAHVQHVWQTGSPAQLRRSEGRDHGIVVADYAVFEPNDTDLVEYQHVPQTADGVTTSDFTSNTTNFAVPTWSTPAGEMPTQAALRFYRYHVAPWVCCIHVYGYNCKLT